MARHANLLYDYEWFVKQGFQMRVQPLAATNEFTGIGEQEPIHMVMFLRNIEVIGTA